MIRCSAQSPYGLSFLGKCATFARSIPSYNWTRSTPNDSLFPSKYAPAIFNNATFQLYWLRPSESQILAQNYFTMNREYWWLCLINETPSTYTRKYPIRTIISFIFIYESPERYQLSLSSQFLNNIKRIDRFHFQSKANGFQYSELNKKKKFEVFGFIACLIQLFSLANCLIRNHCLIRTAHIGKDRLDHSKS